MVAELCTERIFSLQTVSEVLKTWESKYLHRWQPASRKSNYSLIPIQSIREKTRVNFNSECIIIYWYYAYYNDNL